MKLEKKEKAKPATQVYRRLRIDVTQDHISTAARASSSHCMIADAIKASFARIKKKVTMVAVDLATIRFTNPESRKRYVYFTPLRAQAALLKFDEGVDQAPFSFELYRAAQVIPLEAKGTGRNPSRKREVRIPVTKRKDREGRTTNKHPTIVGGRPLPRATLGARRMYGVRAARGRGETLPELLAQSPS